MCRAADDWLIAGKLTRTRGRLIVMGVFEKPAPLDFTDLVFREKTVSGSMSGFGLYDETIRMMTDPRFKGEELITGRILSMSWSRRAITACCIRRKIT